MRDKVLLLEDLMEGLEFGNKLMIKQSPLTNNKKKCKK